MIAWWWLIVAAWAALLVGFLFGAGWANAVREHPQDDDREVWL
jgi:hypothetical protein